ncbi:putative CRISPR-associated protein [Cylindrospermopsis curvispora]|uniref:Putative CRISPR-associated protein n=1 Tax=Cylindrospermopsis curvispora GIHE-G1 TaxID=2666332 RepID=A0A7H0EZ89_9CYAN|nr:putative CRISPR-associated protein [Cylindrospermopsis curvispora]QNP29105.1 putative CRISPR-associated protein [Cylindrospermopsis curvispora GIHE-G1]
MENPLFVFSPCGTSLLTNQAAQEERGLVSKHANAKHIEDIPLEDSLKLRSLAKRVEEKLAFADLELAGKMSAELNGIIKLYNGKLEKKADTHYLLCTDTWLGEQTATLVEQWLREKGFIVDKNRQTDLQTKDIDSFQIALSDIVKFFEKTIPGYRKSQYKIIFNLTGGFKSVQGFLQTLATFYADETIYIFETAKDLLRIPRLPVKMVVEDSVRDHLKVFRRLANEMKTTDVIGVPETLLMRVGGEVYLSPWGDLVWGRTKKEIYGEKLHPSPSEKVSYGPKFEDSLRGISADRLILINERIDQLAKNLESGGKYNVSSLDLKALKGNPRPPSTHEIDAWSDQDAKRIFGHFESGNHFVLDKLDSGLH